MSPFCFWLLLFSSSWARPTTPARPPPPLWPLVAALHGGPLLATGDSPAAPTSASPPVVSVRWPVPRQVGPPRRSVSRAPEFPATAAIALDTRSPGSPPALRKPALGFGPARSGGSAAPTGKTGCC